MVIGFAAGLIGGALRGAAKLPGLMKGPFGFGLSALLPREAGGLKYVLPAMGLGAYGLGKAAYGGISGAYSMDNSNVAFADRIPKFGLGGARPNTGMPMQFGTFSRSYLDYNATGSLMFGLHNRR